MSWRREIYACRCRCGPQFDWIDHDLRHVRRAANQPSIIQFQTRPAVGYDDCSIGDDVNAAASYLSWWRSARARATNVHTPWERRRRRRRRTRAPRRAAPHAIYQLTAPDTTTYDDAVAVLRAPNSSRDAVVGRALMYSLVAAVGATSAASTCMSLAARGARASRPT